MNCEKCDKEFIDTMDGCASLILHLIIMHGEQTKDAETLRILK